MKKAPGRFWFLVAAVVLLLGFYQFSRLVRREVFRDLDFAVTVKVQDRMPERFADFWEAATWAASPLLSIIFMFSLTAWGALTGKGLRRKLGWLVVPLAFFLLTAGEIYGKSVVHHPAPPFFMIKNPTTIFPKYYVNEQFSYPSGHAARATFLVLLGLWLVNRTSQDRRKRWLASILLLSAFAAVAVSRIYLGHHWLADVVGGSLLGGSLGFFSLAWL